MTKIDFSWMNQPFYMSIKTKLFLILSALMALILILQFFLAYQAQKELLVELGDLSKTINTAIDSHYAQVLEDIQNVESLEKDKEKLLGDSDMFIDTQIHHPERVILVIDSCFNPWSLNDRPQANGPPFAYYYWHNRDELGWGNIAFVDLHIEYKHTYSENPRANPDYPKYNFQNGPDWTFIYNH